LGMPESQRARFPTLGIDQDDGPKAMPGKQMIWD
jgi:hypothetical protein